MCNELYRSTEYQDIISFELHSNWEMEFLPFQGCIGLMLIFSIWLQPAE